MAYARAAGPPPAAGQKPQRREDDGERPTEAEGLRLHLSDTNASGYKGVVEQKNGRFQAQLWRGDKTEQLGYYDTAVEAAVAYARAVGPLAARPEQPRAPAGGLAGREPSRAEPAAKRPRTSPGSVHGVVVKEEEPPPMPDGAAVVKEEREEPPEVPPMPDGAIVIKEESQAP